MRKQQIRELLHHANDKQIEQIAAYPAADEQTRQRMFRELQRRKAALSGDTAPEHTPAPAGRSLGWSHYAGLAAAFLLVIGSAAGGAYLLHHAPRNPQMPETSAAAPQEAVPTQVPAASDAASPLPTEAPSPTDPEPLTKELIFYRCNTALQHLTQLSGHIDIWDTNFDFVLAGDIRFDYDAARFYGVVQQLDLDTGRVVFSDERFVSDGREARFCDQEDWDFIYVDGAPGHSDKASFSLYDGQLEVDRNNYRNDPTGFHELAGCFQPNDMTGGYLSDMSTWDITGTEIVQGRECAVIEGTTDRYGSRWKVTHFTVKADIETGVWLFYEGYGDDGAVNSYLYTRDMVFGDASQEVPGITEEEIDRRIAAGYPMDEESCLRRERIQAELAAKAAAAPETLPGEYAAPYIEPETMPAPFADGAVPAEFCHPCEPRFEDIPPELAALVPAEDYAAWLAGWTPLEETAVTSVADYPNKFTFVRDFGLTDAQVRDALRDYICAWDYDISLRDDEVDAFISGNGAAMAEDFARWESIVVRDRIYTPKWMYEHSIQDYVNAGITPQQVSDRMIYYEQFDLTEEAKRTFLEKLAYYTREIR